MKISDAPRYVRWISWFPISITQHLVTWMIWMEFHKPWPTIDLPGEGDDDDAN